MRAAGDGWRGRPPLRRAAAAGLCSPHLRRPGPRQRAGHLSRDRRLPAQRSAPAGRSLYTGRGGATESEERRPRPYWSDRRALTPWSRCAQPIAGIQRDAALAANLEVKVWAFVARLAADVADHLSANDPIARADGRIIQVGVERVVAPAVVDQHRRQVEPERTGEADRAGRDCADRRADRGLDADPVAWDARVVGTGRRAEGIDDRPSPFHRPVETAEVGGCDGAGPRGYAARLRCAPRALECLNAVVERFLVAIEARQSLLCLARVAPSLPQVRLPLVLEREVTPQFVGPLAPAPAQRLARIHEELALPLDAAPQLVHVVREQPVLLGDEMEVLVARQQVAETFGGEQHLPTVQRPPLVDIHEPPLQNRALLKERVLGDQQVNRDLVDLPAESRDLAVQLVDDTIGRLLLRFDVCDFVGERVRLRAEPRQLLLDFRALAADALEAALVLLHLLLVRRALGDGWCGHKHRYHAPRTTHRLHTRFRCLPTLIVLPNSPISAPNAMMAAACSCVKKAAWSRYRLISV